MLGQVIHAELVLGSERVHYKDDECPSEAEFEFFRCSLVSTLHKLLCRMSLV